MSQVIYKTTQGENGDNMTSEYTEEFILITLNFFLSFNFEWSFDHVTFRTLNWGTTKKILFFFKDRVSYTPSCLQTYSIVKARLELLIFLPLLPNAGKASMYHSTQLMWLRNQTQSSVQAR